MSLRRNDGQIHSLHFCSTILRHISVAWDDVYGGVFSGLKHVDDNIWNMGKPLYNHAESLIGLLAIIEHTGNSKAIEWFSKIYDFTIRNYVQKDRGYILWQDNGDRQVTLQEHGARAENFITHVILRSTCMLLTG
ncbi:MAG: hypothetical protein JXB48_04170 [Candidatus Latescibacteria bacterium]|nr:hypothetical protein [Candidatus Latescibacterota bacterium]